MNSDLGVRNLVIKSTRESKVVEVKTRKKIKEKVERVRDKNNM